MLDQLLPARVDNTYRGHKLALWVFGVVVFLKATQSLMSIINTYAVATGPDGVPLDTYTPAAAGTVVSLFALGGLSYLMICLLCIVVLVRYRSLVPLLFALLVLDYLSRRAILHFLPIVRTGTPPATYMNLAFFTAMIVGLALSLWSRSDLRAGES